MKRDAYLRKERSKIYNQFVSLNMVNPLKFHLNYNIAFLTLVKNNTKLKRNKNSMKNGWIITKIQL